MAHEHHFHDAAEPIQPIPLYVIEDESFAFDSILQGIYILPSLHFYENELKNLQRHNQTVEKMIQSGIIGYLLPYVSINFEQDIIASALEIANRLALEIPEDSPLQNPDFIQNMLVILINTFYPNQIKVLGIIHNILIDDLIGETVFEILNNLNFVGVLDQTRFFNIEYSNEIAKLYHTSELEEPICMAAACLSEYLAYSSEEELTALSYIITKAGNEYITTTKKQLSKEFIKIIRYLMKCQSNLELAVKSNIPAILLDFLSLKHDDVDEVIYICFNYFYKMNETPVELLSHKFFELTRHLLFTSSKNTILRIIKTIDTMTVDHCEVLYRNNIIHDLVALDKDDPIYTIREAASFVILDFFQQASLEMMLDLFESNSIEVICDVAQSFEANNILFVLNTFVLMKNKYTEVLEYMKQSETLNNFLSDLISHSSIEVAEFSNSLFNLLFTQE